MRCHRQIFKAGNTLLVKERAAYKRIKEDKRNPKENLTSEEVWQNNIKNSIFELTLILNENFHTGDYHVCLTYEENKEPGSEEEFKKTKNKFLRKFRDELKRRGLDAKYVMVPHRVSKDKERYHYHFICSRIPREVISKCWPHGYIFWSELWNNPNRYALAKYLIKGAAKGLKDKNLIGVRKFTRSRNIIIPEGETVELEENLEDDPKIFKGYVLDGEVQRYEHAITRTTCREYILVADGTRNRRMNKKLMKPIEKINWTKLLRESYQEEQLNLFQL